MWDLLALASTIILCIFSLPLAYHFGQKKNPTSSMVSLQLLLLVNWLIFEMVYLPSSLRAPMIFATLFSFAAILILLDSFIKNPSCFEEAFWAALEPLMENFREKPFLSLPSPLPTLEECLAAQEKDFNLLVAMVVLAKEANPQMDLHSVERDVSRILQGAQSLKRADWTVEERVQALGRYIYQTLGFEVDNSPNKHNDFCNLLINEILLRKKSYCLGLSALYLIIAENLDLSLYGVSVPGHFFVRYDDGKTFRRNIETTAQGAFYPDEYYKNRYQLQKENIEQGVYLANLRKREVLVEFLNNRGNYYYRQGLMDLAERDFNRAIAYSVNFVAAYTSKGFIALRRGDLKEALEYLEEALAIDPSCRMALLCTGEIYMRLNSLKKAETCLERLVELDPENPLAYTNLGLISARRGKLEKAIELHQKALFYDPHCLYAHNNLGATYYRLKKFEESLASFQFVLKINPHFFPAMHNILRTLKGAGMKDLAQVRKRELVLYYQGLLQKEPHNDKYLFELAKLCKDDKQDLGEAINLIRRALVERPSYPDYVEFLAECYSLRGENLKAHETLKFFLEDQSGKYLYDRRKMEDRAKKYGG